MSIRDREHRFPPKALVAKPMTIDELIDATYAARMFWFDIAKREMLIDILMAHLEEEYVIDYKKEDLVRVLLEQAREGTKGYTKMSKSELVQEVRDLIRELTDEPLTPQEPRS